MEELDRTEQMATRCYAVPFHDAWSAVLATVESARGWRITSKDSRAGQIEAQKDARVLRRASSLRASLWLDELGLTRVGVSSSSERESDRFFRGLERALARTVKKKPA